MLILESALSVTFAAVCLWLAVRVLNQREKWAKRALLAAVVGVPGSYIVSFGPACWLAIPENENSTSESARFERWLFSDPVAKAPRIYWPIGWFSVNGPSPVKRCISWYATLGVTAVKLPKNRTGDSYNTLAANKDLIFRRLDALKASQPRMAGQPFPEVPDVPQK